jgi:hypothetical protein
LANFASRGGDGGSSKGVEFSDEFFPGVSGGNVAGVEGKLGFWILDFGLNQDLRSSA